MQITYIHHSAILIELEKHLLLFDYEKGMIPTLSKDKKLYIFVSHHHHDHYNQDIYRINHPNIHYILSNDVVDYPSSISITSVEPNKTYTFEDLTITTLRSTDEGVAFMLKIENTSIYFAGDLHWWHFEGEDNLEQMKENYLKEIKHIWSSFDVAFVVLDSRLEDHYALGINAFLEYTKVSYLFPIHMWNDYSIIERYKKEYPTNKNIMNITHKNQVFHL